MRWRSPSMAAALVLLATAAHAQAPAPAIVPEGLTVEARLDLGDAGTSVPLGAPFRLIIEARHPPGGIALLPASLDVGANLVERVDARRRDRRRVGVIEIDEYTLQLLPFATGDLTIPPIQLALGSTVASTEPLAVFVTSGFSDDEQPIATSTSPKAADELEKMVAQNPAPKPIFVKDNSLLYSLGWLVVGMLVLYVAFRLWRYQAYRPAPEPPPPPPRPAHEIALEALAALRRSPLLARDDFKGFYTELSLIVRRYLGDRYGFESLELTYDEIMEALSLRATPGLDTPTLQHLLTLADQVKFAKFVPRKEERLDALKQVEAMVHATKPLSAPTLTAKGLS